MKASFSIWQVLTLLVVLAPTLYLVWAWPALPAQVPTHFGSDGINGYTSREHLWWMTTALPLAIYIGLLFLPRFDPRRRLVADSRSLHKIILLLVGGVGLVACYCIYLGLHAGMQPGRGMNVGIALFFVLLGNYLTTVPPNYFMGVRTPWALENDMVWTKTHRLIGRLFFGGGLAAALLGGFGPVNWFEPFFLVLVLGTALLAYGYSYWEYQRVLKTAR